MATIKERLTVLETDSGYIKRAIQILLIATFGNLGFNIVPHAWPPITHLFNLL